jgi:hypothetical protein
MKATEIVDKLKSVLLSSDENVQETAEEQVELKAEEVEVNDAIELEEMPEDEMAPEDVAEDVAEEVEKYATKEELESAIAEMKAMYEAIVEKMGSEEMEVEVPAEELAKEELSSQEPAGEPITHTPEVEERAKLNFFNQAKPRTTMSNVYEKMFNK